MSVQEMGHAAAPEEAAPVTVPLRVITLASIIGAVSVTVFVGTELLAAAIVLAWAASGMLATGPMITVILHAATLTAASAVTVWAARLAWEAETRPENNS